jgi:hypothetical protein
MFEDSPAESPRERKRITTGTAKAAPVDWDKASQDELLRWYSEIQMRLPPLALSEMSVEKELVLQFHTVRALQAAVMDDSEIPTNQRAQVANSVAANLRAMAELQERVYTSERFKNIENLLVKELKKLPEAVSAAFLDEYEKILRKYA